MKLWLEIGLLLFNPSLGRVVFLKIWFACAHLKSSGNKPERSDAFLPSQDLLRDDLIIFLTSAVVAGSNDASLEFSCGESTKVSGV